MLQADRTHVKLAVRTRAMPAVANVPRLSAAQVPNAAATPGAGRRVHGRLPRPALTSAG
jgi:hypothetical protein